MSKKRKKTKKKKKKSKEKKKIRDQRKMAEREIRLLEQGYVPEKTKIGSKFKGKNKIIIAKG